MTDKNTTSINFEMTEQTNKELTKSARANGRTKRHEAKIRLEDHVNRFELDSNSYVDKSNKN